MKIKWNPDTNNADLAKIQKTKHKVQSDAWTEGNHQSKYQQKRRKFI